MALYMQIIFYQHNSNANPFHDLVLSSISYYANGLVTKISVVLNTNAVVNGNPMLNPAQIL